MVEDEFRGRVALVTGAAALGIGRATAAGEIAAELGPIQILVHNAAYNTGETLNVDSGGYMRY